MPSPKFIRLIYDLAARGIGILVVSSELPEVLGIADRILVMRQGQIVANLPRDAPEASPESILRLALPVSLNSGGSAA